ETVAHGRRGIHDAVEQSAPTTYPACPAADARALAAVRLARDPVRKSLNSARMLRRPATGEQADGQVEAPPPEMRRTGLPGEPGSESLEEWKHRCKRFAKSSSGVAVVIA